MQERFSDGEKIYAKVDVYIYEVSLLEMMARRSSTDELSGDDYCVEKIVAEVIDPSLSHEINRQETEAVVNWIMEEVINERFFSCHSLIT